MQLSAEHHVWCKYVLLSVMYACCTPLCSCFDAHTRDRICSACSTSFPCSLYGGALLVRGRNCGKVRSRSGRISSDGNGRKTDISFNYKKQLNDRMTENWSIIFQKAIIHFQGLVSSWITSCRPLLAQRRQTGCGVVGIDVRTLRPPISHTFWTAQSSLKTN